MIYIFDILGLSIDIAVIAVFLFMSYVVYKLQKDVIKLKSRFDYNGVDNLVDCRLKDSRLYMQKISERMHDDVEEIKKFMNVLKDKFDKFSEVPKETHANSSGIKELAERIIIIERILRKKKPGRPKKK